MALPDWSPQSLGTPETLTVEAYAELVAKLAARPTAVTLAVTTQLATASPNAEVSATKSKPVTSPSSDQSSASVQAPVPVSGLGWVLAEPVVAQTDLPPFNTAAMDGFAVRAADLAPTSADQPTAGSIWLPVVLDIRAGQPQVSLPPGQAARIMTGAVLPTGADTVIPWEDTTIDGDRVALPTRAKLGANVRRAGEAAVSGQPLLAAGTRLGPGQLAVLASTGQAAVKLWRRPRVAIIATGDELAAPGVSLASGQIYDSNTSFLRAWFESHGSVVVSTQRVGDRADDLTAALDVVVGVVSPTQATPTHVSEAPNPSPTRVAPTPFPIAAASIPIQLAPDPTPETTPPGRLPDSSTNPVTTSNADLIILSGGASFGEADLVRLLAQSPAASGVHGVHVAMKPGKPQVCGRWRGVPFLGFPGNPLSVAISAELFGAAFLNASTGLAVSPVGPPAPEAATTPEVTTTPASQPSPPRARLTVALSSPAGRRGFVPVRVTPSPDGYLEATPTSRGAGSHLVAALAQADAWAVVPEAVTHCESGQLVELLPAAHR
ncbi:MAG: molybdopterin molybdotransferase MoeA [Propionibacteriaceae bacterium]|nr:molybdopterin molybdotransferase MoeA [Propionibacteriaceae bacterium]